MRKLINYVLLLLLMGLQQSSIAQLTGEWTDNNGACYKLRQINDQIFWTMDGSPRVINVFTGYKAGNIITGQWADVPGGYIQGNGTLSLRVENNNRMVKIDQNGNYDGSVWTRGSCSMTIIGLWSSNHQHQGCSSPQSYCKSYPGDMNFMDLPDGRIQASWKDHLLTGSYNPGSREFIHETYVGSEWRGRGVFVFSEDLKSFYGTWEGTPGHRGIWTGTRK